MSTGKQLPEETKPLVYQPLRGKKLVLGVTGSSAIYKSIDLARKLIRMGASIKVVMTKFSTRLVGPDLFHWAVGSNPLIEMTGETEHIDLAKWGDAMVIAPATLNTMSKIAYGVLDELLPLTATTMLGEGKTVIVVPSMNVRLMNSPQYRRSAEVLREMGVVIIPPLLEEDKAKYPPLEDLAHCVDAVVNRGRDLEGLSVLVTAGPTREYIDPVRVITNPSTGLMGVLIAREAACRGANVTLVHGPLAVNPPYLVERVYTETTEDMAKAVTKLTSEREHDIAVFAAAPSDFKPVTSSDTKIQSRATSRLTIELEATPKVIRSLSRRPRVVVGFAAETVKGDELVEKAHEKLVDYGVDLVIANNVLSSVGGFGKEFLEMVAVSRDGLVRSGVSLKYEIARFVLDYAKGLLGRR